MILLQTFLPYESFEKSAEVLDDKRLGKQRVEVLQILNALNDPNSGWRVHPATKMWAGYPSALALYGMRICSEWIGRGFEDDTSQKIAAVAIPQSHAERPPWLGDAHFHRSHQSNLVRKNPDYYRRYFPDVPDNMDYVWPESDYELE